MFELITEIIDRARLLLGRGSLFELTNHLRETSEREMREIKRGVPREFLISV